MSCLASFPSFLKFTERICQGAVSTDSESQQQSAPPDNSTHTTSIHILDDDSLLNIFYLYRPFLLGEDEDVNIRIEGGRLWARERWWYRLTHVCQRWRNLILGSASYLGLCLVCTYGTPVTDMLAHSPPVPLVIDCLPVGAGRDISAKDQDATILALGQRDRVRRVRLSIPALRLQELIVAIDGEYPILEYLILVVPIEDKRKILPAIIPETLQTPHLRHLAIDCSIPIPIRSPLLGTAAGLLVTLHLALSHPSAYFQPNVLLQWLSLMPQLENLRIFFNFAVPSSDVEMQLLGAPITTHATLPNLRFFVFQVASAYSEVVLSRITASRLEIFQIRYPEPLTSSVPYLLQFMRRTETLKFDRARFYFYSERAYVKVNPSATSIPVTAFSINVDSWPLSLQVSSMAQMFTTLSQILSAVEHLTLWYEEYRRSFEEYDEVDRTEWLKLLRSFSNVKTLRIEDGLVRELSRCLRLEDGEDPLDLLPELQELTYSGSGNTDDAFTPFIDARQNADRPVILIKS